MTFSDVITLRRGAYAMIDGPCKKNSHEQMARRRVKKKSSIGWKKLTYRRCALDTVWRASVLPFAAVTEIT